MNFNTGQVILDQIQTRPMLPFGRAANKSNLQPERGTLGAQALLTLQYSDWMGITGLGATTFLVNSPISSGTVEFSNYVVEPTITATYTGLIASVAGAYDGLIVNVADTYEGLSASPPLLQRRNYQLAKSAEDMTRLIGATYIQGAMDIPELARLLGSHGREGDIALLLEENGFFRSVASNTLTDEKRSSILADIARLMAQGTAHHYDTVEWTIREVVASQRIESIYVDPTDLT